MTNAEIERNIHGLWFTMFIVSVLCAVCFMLMLSIHNRDVEFLLEAAQTKEQAK